MRVLPCGMRKAGVCEPSILIQTIRETEVPLWETGLVLRGQVHYGAACRNPQ